MGIFISKLVTEYIENANNNFLLTVKERDQKMLANFTDKAKMVTVFTRTIFVSRTVAPHQTILFICYVMRRYIIQHTSSMNRSSVIEL